MRQIYFSDTVKTAKDSHTIINRKKVSKDTVIKSRVQLKVRGSLANTKPRIRS